MYNTGMRLRMCHYPVVHTYIHRWPNGVQKHRGMIIVHMHNNYCYCIQ